ncbi:hypothetical protein D3C77_572960 [compost metagenome]
MHGDDVVGRRLRALGSLDHFVLQAGLGGLHAFALGIFLEEFLAGLDRLGVHFSHALFRTLLQEGKRLHQLLVGQLLFLLADGVLDALRHCLRVEIIHPLLRQALAHIQADPVGRLLRRSFQLDTGLRVAAGQYQANQGDR